MVHDSCSCLSWIEARRADRALAAVAPLVECVKDVRTKIHIPSPNQVATSLSAHDSRLCETQGLTCNTGFDRSIACRPIPSINLDFSAPKASLQISRCQSFATSSCALAPAWLRFRLGFWQAAQQAILPLFPDHSKNLSPIPLQPKNRRVLPAAAACIIPEEGVGTAGISNFVLVQPWISSFPGNHWGSIGIAEVAEVLVAEDEHMRQLMQSSGNHSAQVIGRCGQLRWAEVDKPKHRTVTLVNAAGNGISQQSRRTLALR